jgi:GNAT superfamily N-acetyltransferase
VIGAVRVEVVDEDEISPSLRLQLGALIADGFGAEDPRETAYWGETRPVMRVLAHQDDRVVGQQSVFWIKSRPRRRVFGLGDIAVESDWRGQGIARQLVRAAVDLCRARDAQVILTRTTLLRSTFAALDFTAVKITAAAGSDWMAWSQGPLPDFAFLDPDDV